MTHKYEHIRSHRLTRRDGQEMCTVCGHKFCWILAYYRERSRVGGVYVDSAIGCFNYFENGPAYSPRVTRLLTGIDWSDFDKQAIPDDGVPF